jgi:hypothetical protein
VLSDRDGLLDEVVEVLGDGWGETCWISFGPGTILSSFRLQLQLHDRRVPDATQTSHSPFPSPFPSSHYNHLPYAHLILLAHPTRRKKPTVSLQDPEDLVSGNEFDLGDTVRVSEDDTDLRRRKTSPGELEDLVRDLLGGGLGPRWLRTSEW